MSAFEERVINTIIFFPYSYLSLNIQNVPQVPFDITLE